MLPARKLSQTLASPTKVKSSKPVSIPIFHKLCLPAEVLPCCAHNFFYKNLSSLPSFFITGNEPIHGCLQSIFIAEPVIFPGILFHCFSNFFNLLEAYMALK